MILLKKFERMWKTHETLHQLKDTLMRYGMDLTTPLSRIDNDYSRWDNCAFKSDIIRFKYRSSRATQAMSAQAKDIKILDNLFDWTVNRDDAKVTAFINQECDFINFCGTRLLNAGYVSSHEHAFKLRDDLTDKEFIAMKPYSTCFINSIFNNEVKNGWFVYDRIFHIGTCGWCPTIRISSVNYDRCFNGCDGLPTALKVNGYLILNECFTPKMLLKGLQGKTTSSEFNAKKFCFAAGLRSSITWDAYVIGLDDNKELVWEMFLDRNKFRKSTFQGILCSFILKNSELKDFIKHVVDGQMKDYMSAVREVRKVQVKQASSKWKC